MARERTETLPNGTKVVRRKIEMAPVREWRLQGSAVRRLRSMRGFGTAFTTAGDMNAGKRGPKAQLEAKVTGLEAGEPDLRVYLRGGRLGLIEFKTPTGRLSPAQHYRHGVLRALGFDVVVVQVATEDEAADRCEALVKAWLAGAANDNAKLPAAADRIVAIPAVA